MTKPKYAAHGEPGTEAWIEVYADTCTEAEKRHKIYAHAPEILEILEAIITVEEENIPHGIYGISSFNVSRARAAINKALGK